MKSQIIFPLLALCGLFLLCLPFSSGAKEVPAIPPNDFVTYREVQSLCSFVPITEGRGEILGLLK